MFVVWLSRRAQSLLAHTATAQLPLDVDDDDDDDEVDGECKRRFESAAEHVQSVAAQLDADTLLYLYARFKQATEGPCVGQSRPSLFDPKARRKYDAWLAVRRMSRRQAMEEYVDRVAAADCGWDPHKTASGRQGFGLKPSRPVLPDDDDDASDSAWFAAVKASRVSEVRAALDAHPEWLTTRDDAGMTALHWAADHGDEATVALLLGHAQCPIDAQDEAGQTALHYAASCAHSTIVDLLLKANADPSIHDADGLTAAQVTDCPAIELLMIANQS